MSCVDLMYQFYSPYFSYKSPAADDTSVQKFSSQPLYDAGITSTAAVSATANNFLENPHLPHPPHHTNTTTSSTTNNNNSNSNSNNNSNSSSSHHHHHHHHTSDNNKETRNSDKTSSPHHHQHHQQPPPPHPPPPPSQPSQSSQSQHQQQQHPPQHQHHQQNPQPRTTHYLTSNCVLFTYFNGETGTVVDEHFSRALSQPSSFTLDKPPPNSKSFSRSESLLMCHRKLPPSFWNSSYQPPPCTNGGTNNFAAFGADAYFQSSLYNFHKTWPYHYSHHAQSHSYPHHQSASHGLSYPGMDTTGRLSSHYGSFMMPPPSHTHPALSSRVPGDSRSHAAAQYDFSKTTTDAFSNYYGMGRFGSDVEAAGLSGLDMSRPQAKKELYW